ncbi:hypothetical protein GGP81_002093 [Salinibacter ruber]|nr:hypothetical protein [Salinibacter ruber]
MRTDPETAPSDADLEALYDDLFETPALDAIETEGRDELDAYAAVYKVAKNFPAVARKAARDGTSAHYRGAGPFNYSVGETRRCGEVAR